MPVNRALATLRGFEIDGHPEIHGTSPGSSFGFTLQDAIQ
jgi:hypothetical protein